MTIHTGFITIGKYISEAIFQNFSKTHASIVGRQDMSVDADEMTPVKAHDVSNKTARRLEWLSVGHAGRKHTKTKWENGAKWLPAFRRGWVRVLIRDRGPETQDTLQVEKRGETGINESGLLPATDRAASLGKGVGNQ